MLATAREDVLGFIRNLMGTRKDECAYALYPDLAPPDAIEQLNRNIRGKEKRKLGVHELDTIFDVLGEEAEEAYLRFVMKRRGIVPPDVFQRDDEIAQLRKELHEAREQAMQHRRASDRLLEVADRIEERLR